MQKQYFAPNKLNHHFNFFDYLNHSSVTNMQILKLEIKQRLNTFFTPLYFCKYIGKHH